MGRLKGKAALVTGGALGIGRTTCLRLAGEGARVAVTDTRDADGRYVVTAITAAGGEAGFWHLDVSDESRVRAAVEDIVQAFGGLDILVNNAGVAINGLLLRFSDEQWQKTLAVNLGGAFHCIRAAASLLLRARAAGRIINITSVVGETGNAGQAAYAASKAGLIGLTMSTARELASRGITCNAIAPGYIETDMTTEHLPEAQRTKLIESIPLGKIGRPEDVADAAAFLAGPEAAYITGQVLRVNGGMLM